VNISQAFDIAMPNTSMQALGGPPKNEASWIHPGGLESTFFGTHLPRRIRDENVIQTHHTAKPQNRKTRMPQTRVPHFE